MKPLENVEVKLRNLLVNTLQTLHQVQCLPLLPHSPALVMSIPMRHRAKPRSSCSAVRPLGTEQGRRMCPWGPLRQVAKRRAPKPLTRPTTPTNRSTDQQGSFVLPAKASKVQPKRAMVPWWQTNNIKANQIISITMAKRGNTRGTRPSQTSVDSHRCTMDGLLCAVTSSPGQLPGDSWDTFGSLTLFSRWFSHCVFSQLAMEWIMKTDNCKKQRASEKRAGKRLLVW